MKKFNTVFKVSAGIMLVLVIIGVVWPDGLEQMTTNVKDFIAHTLGWYYLIVVTLFVLVCLAFLFTPLGRIKLGKKGETPEFSRPTWIAMLFSAGMGIGIVFWGTAEPINHYALSSPTGETGTDQAIKDAMRFTFFHWGIHAWAIYGIVALVLAYFNFRHDHAGLISATLKPLIGEKAAEGVIGKVIDILAVIATVIGVATTLGFGAVQINGGLSFLFDIPTGILVQFIIIAVVTVLFMISAWTGLGKGIKILSNANMGLAALLFLLLFIVGPTMFILNLFTSSIGAYFQYLPTMSFRIAPLNPDTREWINAWTIFYWAWWIAWSPFVGVFIARVSRGRSIREFVFTVLVVPSVIGFLWFATFGGTAINLEHNAIDTISSLATEESLFGVFSNVPLGWIASIVAMTLIATFFITSADSGTFVLGMMTTGGSETPGTFIKLTWGGLLSATALALLYTGGLQALQNTMIIAALPFSIIMLMMVISFVKAIYKEGRELGIGRFHKPKDKKS
ncbi:BCCT family transporter [Halobacillus karajensis]|uniref:Glycine betaine transporter OpuD n=1 Tax=Halobacillus karajensis TaxID=195088 RepID=A0A024P2U0_9BACI|nr:BCCT family transporter [Halobacillus karajensis]CDQ19975.1 Glycine betaine transporter OpuD [Halobacillus karajensis]CDQ22435.1 Glycine betaine transporter OpuD [Halobacillus karajensis]CDQ28278.1 Glycine betaine transporter OpuD [Halobacillus karajensis]